MTTRSITTRIEKLEARRRNDDEMLMLWRKPGADIDAAVSSANKAGMFGSGDLVLCGEWHGEDDPPAARWVQRIKSDLTEPEMGSLYKTLKKMVVDRSDNSGTEDMPAPYLSHLSDETLWQLAIGVRT
ncbi:hypothetical protein NB311A_07278 [Nitrobacter sp. Nb-311A]|uniref:hypothetical protein n=1 Tax=Nitrobacter sp. Nb-311A TaxID=314253 RepID=UPI0000684C23|nr:hypothetical protein [Nitrobacter sp. Nb-311A]EAQ36932.1 hypothetical protein NB311A_07278 [Nitrobacter sp. Nb-311A]